MPGRAKTPVQQAWEYANDAPGAKWVLVSNCSEIDSTAMGAGARHMNASTSNGSMIRANFVGCG